MKLSLPFKTTILFLTLSGFGVLFISLLGYYSADKFLRNEALSNLSSDLMRENISLESNIKTLKEDVRFMSNVPPVQGIIRAAENEGFDEQENTMIDVWERRLISIFSTVIRQRSAYTQIRFIGAAEGGREIVRVNQSGERVTVVGKDDLQAKGGRDYFRKIAKTKKGGVYISDINYNREHGEIARPLQLVIRVGIPVLKKSGEIFGMIVINADIRKFASSLYGYAKDQFFFLANEKGQYLIHPDENRRMAFEFGRSITFQKEYGLGNNYLGDNRNPFTIMELPGKRGGMALHKIYFDEQDKNRFLLLGAIVNFAHLTEKSRSLGKDLAILTTAVFMFIGIISGFAVRWLIRPILHLKAISDRITAGEEDVEIKIESNDEVGDLAESMAMMLEKQRNAQDELRELTGSLEEKVRERTIKLEALNKEMESFVYTVSHDLKSPIVSLQGMVELIGEELGDNSSDDIRTYLGHMKNSITMMGDLAEDLLTLSRVGRIDFACEEIDTNDIVAQVVHEQSGPAAEKGVDIVLSPNLPVVMANKKRLYQIFSNLIGNAVKFMPDGAESPLVEISSTLEGDTVTFVVKDNGEGIDPKHHERIFTMFQRLHGRDIPGTGMGLALVKKIVENLGGSITVRSSKGTGTAFYFTLPATGRNFLSETTS